MRAFDPETIGRIDSLAHEVGGARPRFLSEYVHGPSVRAENARNQTIRQKQLDVRVLQRALSQRFARALRNGELVAVGVFEKPHLSREPETIPAHLWEFLQPDYAASSARSETVLIHSIRIHSAREHQQPEPTTDTTTATKTTSGAERRCRRWLEQQVADGRMLKRQEAFEGAREVVGDALSYRAFERAWKDVAPAKWKKRGRRPESPK